MATKALFAGSFDPITKGHIDLIERSALLFEDVTVLVSNNTEKTTLFTAEERKELAQQAVKDMSNVHVDILTDELVVEYAKRHQITAMVRGLRSMGDLDYEMVIAGVNHRQAPNVETVLLLADANYRYLSSTIVKEIASYHGDVSEMVDKDTAIALQKKYREK